MLEFLLKMLVIMIIDIGMYIFLVAFVNEITWKGFTWG
jgi:hypothetical protein